MFLVLNFHWIFFNMLCWKLTCGPLILDLVVSRDSVHRDVHAHVYWHGGEMVRGAEAAPGCTGRERGCVLGVGSPPEPLHRVIVGPRYRVSRPPLMLPVIGTGNAVLLAVTGPRHLVPPPRRGALQVARGRRAGDWLGWRVRRPRPCLPWGREGAGVHHHVLQGQQYVGCVLSVVLNLSRAMKLIWIKGKR